MWRSVENLFQVEIGPRFISEAEFRGQRIRVECTYDGRHWNWAYEVFLVTPESLRRLTPESCAYRNRTHVGAMTQGMQYGVDAILAMEHPRLEPDSQSESLQ